MNLQPQPLVSVVTPVYNAEKYLAECIESVLAQTYEHWEYVILNNCSTDRSLEIATSYAEKNRKIRVINNEDFLSALQNQNKALGHICADSKYCKVVHADDWLFPDCIKRMVEVAESNPSIGIVSSYGLHDVQVVRDGLAYPSTVIRGRDICRSSLLGDCNVFGSPTSILMRSDIIRSRRPFYNELYTYADTEVCFEVLQRCDFGFVHQVLSYTRKHNASITASIDEKLNTYISVRLAMVNKYGPVYLGRDEYEKTLRAVINKYYKVLGKSVMRVRERTFWVYHRNTLKDLGHPLSVVRLISSVCGEVFDLAFNPKSSVEKIVKRVCGR